MITESLEAARYRLIRSGEVYIECGDDFYAVIGDGPGKYYPDKNEFDADLDCFIETEKQAAATQKSRQPTP